MPKPQQDMTDLLTRAASAGVSTWNPDARTVECTFVTKSAGVTRYDGNGPYTEFLDPSGFTGGEGVAVLDNHNRWSMQDVLGSVDSLKTVGDEGRAILRLSPSHVLSKQIGDDLSAGIPKQISVGYTVKSYREETNPKTGLRTKTAVKWTVHEISFVAVPADPNSHTRNLDMPKALPQVQEPLPNDPTPSQPSNRAAINTEIRSIAKDLGLPQSFVDSQIDAEATPESARRAAADAMIERSRRAQVPYGQVQFGQDFTDPEFRARTLGEGLYARINPRHNPTEPARQYRAMSMLEIAQDCLRSRSIAFSGLTHSALIERALHSTSDFPLILSDAVGRGMIDAYKISESQLKKAARPVPAPDFRTRYRVKLSEGPELIKVPESGEIKSGTMAEAAETYKLSTYARRIGISRQILMNDDLAAFADISNRVGMAASASEAKLLAGIIEANPKLSDGKAVFHADHGNLAANGISPWVNATVRFTELISEGRLAMRRQKTLAGNPIQVTPTYLIVPPEGESIGEQALATIAAATVTDANPFSGKLALLVDSYLDNERAWYIAADPAQTAGLEYAYLQGEEGPQLDTRAGWEVDGVEIKVRLDFGAGFVDPAGWFKNSGTA